MRLFATFLCSLVLLAVGRVEAQPTSYNQVFVASPYFNAANSKAERLAATVDTPFKSFGQKVPTTAGWVNAGSAGISKVDMNGIGGTAVGLFGIAEGVGRPGPRSEVVGVYGMALKSGVYWATGLHGECVLREGETDPEGKKDTGGQCIGVNVELIGNNLVSGFIGFNLQPRGGAHDVVGMQFQFGDLYRWAIDLDGAALKLGQDDDGVSYCQKFNRKTKRIEYWAHCGTAKPVRTGYLDIGVGTPDKRINR